MCFFFIDNIALPRTKSLRKIVKIIHKPDNNWNIGDLEVCSAILREHTSIWGMAIQEVTYMLKSMRHSLEPVITREQICRWVRSWKLCVKRTPKREPLKSILINIQVWKLWVRELLISSMKLHKKLGFGHILLSLKLSTAWKWMAPQISRVKHEIGFGNA